MKKEKISIRDVPFQVKVRGVSQPDSTISESNEKTDGILERAPNWQPGTELLVLAPTPRGCIIPAKSLYSFLTLKWRRLTSSILMPSITTPRFKRNFYSDWYASNNMEKEMEWKGHLRQLSALGCSKGGNLRAKEPLSCHAKAKWRKIDLPPLSGSL